MKRKAVGVCEVILTMVMCTDFAYANSYLDMLTEPPEGYEQDELTSGSAVIVPSSNANTLDWWYDSRIKTSAPVVVSSYPKYYAWVRARADEDRNNYIDSQIQDFIYAVEGGLVGWGLYEIYRYKHK